MGRINSTFSGGYYQNPEFDVYQASNSKSIKKGIGATKRKVTYMLELALQCDLCSCFIGRMTKVNANVEATDEKYLSLRIYRLEFKCPQCISSITLKTDPKTRGYLVENGARSIGDSHSNFNVKNKEPSTEEEYISTEQRIDAIRAIQDDTDSLFALREKVSTKLNRLHGIQQQIQPEDFHLVGDDYSSKYCTEQGVNHEIDEFDEYYAKIKQRKQSTRSIFNPVSDFPLCFAMK